MNIQSDIRILDNLLALNLTISLWSARKKMTPEDFGGVALPPEDLASLGSKRVADPETLKIFNTLKSRIFSYLDRHGVRFMSGWAIPEDKADLIIQELLAVKDEFMKAKSDFLADYDQSLQAWLEKHKEWAAIIQNSIVSSDYVRARMDFRWQLYKVAPITGEDNQQAALASGLAEEVTGLGQTLFGEVAKSAEEIWKKVYAGKSEVTHKALSPLKTLHAKLIGLSFVEPHVAPVADIILAAINRMPKKGTITGTNLLLLQGLVCLLKDTDNLVAQAQGLLTGFGADSILDALLQPISVKAEPECPIIHVPSSEALPEVIPPVAKPEIPSLGLW